MSHLQQMRDWNQQLMSIRQKCVKMLEQYQAYRQRNGLENQLPHFELENHAIG